MVDPTADLIRVTTILERLSIPYFITGSLAGIVHGIARTTNDADIVVDIHPEHIEPLIEAIGGDAYVDAQMIQDAIDRRGSFNIIFPETGVKVDCFIPKGRPIETSQFARRAKFSLDEANQYPAFFSSAEDLILAKLEWYRAGNEVSSRQWNDIQVVIKVQAERLDRDYLRRWAGEIGVSDLLEKALAEAE